MRLIFDRYSNGYTYNDIAKELNAKGYKTKIEGSQSMYSSYRCGKKQNHKIGCGNSEIEKNRLETFVLEQMQKYLFSDNAIKTIVKQVNEYNISVSKSKNSDLVLYEKQLNEINKQIKNISIAIAKGVNQELMIEQIKSLDSSKRTWKSELKKVKLQLFRLLSRNMYEMLFLNLKSLLKKTTILNARISSINTLTK